VCGAETEMVAVEIRVGVHVVERVEREQVVDSYLCS